MNMECPICDGLLVLDENMYTHKEYLICIKCGTTLSTETFCSLSDYKCLECKSTLYYQKNQNNGTTYLRCYNKKCNKTYSLNQIKIERIEKHLPCHDCNGFYFLKEGKYGIFAGCSNYPKCQSHIPLTEFIINILKKDGLLIYKWSKKCWKCHQTTSIFSYYLAYEIEKYSNERMNSEMGIGDIPILDEYLKKQITTIKDCYSKTKEETYIANTCEHCGALQGYNYVVDDPHEIFDDLYGTNTMEKYLFTKIPYAKLNINESELIKQLENII